MSTDTLSSIKVDENLNNEEEKKETEKSATLKVSSPRRRRIKSPRARVVNASSPYRNYPASIFSFNNALFADDWAAPTRQRTHVQLTQTRRRFFASIFFLMIMALVVTYVSFEDRLFVYIGYGIMYGFQMCQIVAALIVHARRKEPGRSLFMSYAFTIGMDLILPPKRAWINYACPLMYAVLVPAIPPLVNEVRGRYDPSTSLHYTITAQYNLTMSIIGIALLLWSSMATAPTSTFEEMRMDAARLASDAEAEQVGPWSATALSERTSLSRRATILLLLGAVLLPSYSLVYMREYFLSGDAADLVVFSVLQLVQIVATLVALYFMHSLYHEYRRVAVAMRRMCLRGVQAVKDTATLEAWFENRRHVFQFDIAAVYRTVSYGIAVLLAASLVLIGVFVLFVLRFGVAHVTSVPEYVGEGFGGLFGGVALLFVVYEATLVWTEQRRHIGMLRLLRCNVCAPPADNAEAERAAARMRELLDSMIMFIEHNDMPPMVFGITIRPGLFRVLIGYVVAAVATVVARVLLTN